MRVPPVARAACLATLLLLLVGCIRNPQYGMPSQQPEPGPAVRGCFPLDFVTSSPEATVTGHPGGGKQAFCDGDGMVRLRLAGCDPAFVSEAFVQVGEATRAGNLTLVAHEAGQPLDEARFDLASSGRNVTVPFASAADPVLDATLAGVGDGGLALRFQCRPAGG